MSNQSRFRLISIFRLLALTAGVLILVGAGFSLAGWAFDLGGLESLYDGWFRMTPIEAFGLLCAGLALGLLRMPPKKQKPGTNGAGKRPWLSSLLRTVAQGSALITVAVALLALAEHLFKWDPGIDLSQFQLTEALRGGAFPARVKPYAGIGFLLDGGALFLIDAQTRRGRMPAQYLALAVLTGSLLIVVTYLFGAPILFNPIVGAGTIFTIAAGFLILSLGILCARPDRGLMAVMTSETAGGQTARRLLVPAMMAPVILGLAKLLGERAGYFSPGLGIALLIMVLIILFAVMVHRQAVTLQELDTQRLYAEGALRKTYGDLEKRIEEQTAELVRANQDLWAEMMERERIEDEVRRSQVELADFFDNAPISAHKIGPDGTILWANQAELDLLGYTRDEYIGHHIAEFHQDQDLIREILDRLYRGENLDNQEVRLRAKDDSIKLVSISSNVSWKDGEFAYTRCFTKDLSSLPPTSAAVREREEDALDRQELARLEALYQTSPLGMALVDDELRFLKVNGAMAEMNDLPPAQIVGRTVREVRPELAEVIEAHLRQVFGGGQPLLDLELSNVAVGPLSVERDWLATYYPLPGADGEVAAVNLVLMDVTARNLAREALRVNEEQFRITADSAPVMIWMADADRNHYFFNHRWLDFTGRTLDQEQGQGWVEDLHPEDVQRWLEACRASFDSRTDFQLEHRLRHRDGQYRWIIGQGVPHFRTDGSFAGFIGTGIDIHERKQAEEALRQSEEFNRSILESSVDCIEVLDLEGRLISMNGVGQQMMEIDDFDSCAGREWLGLWEPEARESADEAIGSARAGGVGHFMAYCRTMKGTLKWWDVIVSPILDQHGQPERIVSISRDLTDRQRIEEERVQSLAREQAARTEAEEANRLKDEFLATVSHELRAPLNAILGWVKLLREGRLDQEEAERALETVERSARAQNRIVSDLLDVSRIITGKLRLNIRPIEPAFVIEAAVEAVRPAAEAKAIRLEMALDYGAGPISGDSDRLEQIIWNLLSNAIKFTHKFGCVQIRLERVNSSVEITIGDTGQGIDAEFLPYVFDRFRQADSSSTRRQGGLGLGLAIVRHLAEMHGGSVRAESPGSGQGATFTVKLPMMVAPRQALTPGRTVPAIEGSLDLLDCPPQLEGLHILVVDDDPDAQDLIKTILTQCQAVVKTAGSTDEALDIFLEPDGWRPELLISDIEMPGADGYSLIREWRKFESQQGRRIPAIALTAYTRVEDRLRSLSAGFQMHVGKPIEPTELLTIVASLTGRLDKQRKLKDNGQEALI